ncbi:MAG: SIS domain-containing protein [Acidobacteriia bacterium]|nr:SIS domain-containing protein [Terriglobia bacterium]
MRGGFREYLNQSTSLMLAAGEAIGQGLMDAAVDLVVTALSGGKPLLVCGNGGSASDAMHITAELVGRFLVERRPLNVICLSENPAFLTAWSNDCGYETVFARQVEAHGEPGAVLLALSTSGQSKNIVTALERARSLGMRTIALTGEGGGQLGALADCLLVVPSRSTPLIQQVHVCMYHYLCQCIEERILGAG